MAFRAGTVSMVIIMFLIGVLLLLFAGRLIEVLIARARLRDPKTVPVTTGRRVPHPRAGEAAGIGRT